MMNLKIDHGYGPIYTASLRFCTIAYNFCSWEHTGFYREVNDDMHGYVLVLISDQSWLH